MIASEQSSKISVTKNFHLIEHPLAHHKIFLMRKDECSTSKFRDITRELGIFLAYEATKSLYISHSEIISKNGREKTIKKAVIVPILRSGLSMAEGALEIMPSARVGHMGFRKTDAGNVEEHLIFLPDPSGRHFFIMDTEVCTGETANLAILLLKNVHVPGHKITICTILISENGLNLLSKNHPDVNIYAFSVEKLDENKNMSPGFHGDTNHKMFGIR